MTAAECKARIGGGQIHTACYGLVEVEAAVVFLGHDIDSGRWLIWWGELTGLGGAWYDTLAEAWQDFTHLIRFGGIR